MGREQADRAPPRGITIRRHAKRTSLQIAFSYKGIECRETLALDATAANIKYASNLKAEIERKIVLGTFIYTEYFPESKRARLFGPQLVKTTMGTLLRTQLATYQAAVDLGQLAQSTFDGYSKAIRLRLIPKWDLLPVRACTPALLREWIGALGITAKTARNILTPLHSVFEDALNDEIIDFNPFERIALKKLLKQTAKKSEYEVDPFDMTVRGVLLSKCRPDEAPMYRFWFRTGLRPGELIALEWEKIDWVHRRVRIDLNLVSGVEKGPKTEAGIRDVDLDDEAIAALLEQKPYTFLAGGRVFHNPRTGEGWKSDAQLRKTSWMPLVKRSGVRYRNPYQVRHTYASTHLTAGQNPFWLAEQMGHIDTEMVFKVYGKWLPEQYRKQRAAKTISEPDQDEMAA